MNRRGCIYLGLAYFFVSITENAIPIQCPEYSLWTLRANVVCNASNYACLFDDNEKIFVEQCISPDFLGPGFKFVVRGLIDRETCDVSRFQPFIHWTNESSECAYKKTFCNEEGQVVVSNGSTSKDRTCRCDYTREYTYMITPKTLCSCNPHVEDCTCYIKNCPSGYMLSPEYKCVLKSKLTSTFECPEILEHQTSIWTNENEITEMHTDKIFKVPVNNHSKQTATSTMVMLASMSGIIILLEIVHWFTKLFTSSRLDKTKEAEPEESKEAKTIKTYYSNAAKNEDLGGNNDVNRQTLGNIGVTAKRNSDSRNTHLYNRRRSGIMVLIFILGY